MINGCKTRTHHPGQENLWPLSIREEVVCWVNSTLRLRHQGINHTQRLTENKFWWEVLRKKSILSCPVLSVPKLPHQDSSIAYKNLYQSIGYSIALDVVTKFPCSQGHTVTLSITDRFTKGKHLIYLQNYLHWTQPKSCFGKCSAMVF